MQRVTRRVTILSICALWWLVAGSAAPAVHAARGAQARLTTSIDRLLAEQAYLKASNTDAGDRFGQVLALSGDTAVIGAPGESSAATGVNGNSADNSMSSAGAAYVFVRSGEAWTQQAYLKPSNTGRFDSFGFAVAISGDTIVVGAPSEDSPATGVGGAQGDDISSGESGAAYVFVRNGATWTQQAYLKASNTGNFDGFGISVALSGDTIVVGANQERSNATGVNGNQADNSASLAGAAYVFVRTGATWTQQAFLKASNTGANDRFGFPVAISGDTVVVGASSEDSGATGVNGSEADNSSTDAGAAYVFLRSGTTWAQQAYLKASNTGAGDAFGTSLAVSGDLLVVGASGEDGGATGINGIQTDNSLSNAGAAYVFTRTGTIWSQQAYLKSSNTGAGDTFGTRVAASGDTVVVGAPTEDSNALGLNGIDTDNSASEAGAAYVFLRTGTTWAQQAYLKASNTGAGDGFGSAVALSGNTMFIGASNEGSLATGINGNGADNSAAASGAAYAWLRSPAAPVITGVVGGNGQLAVTFTAGHDGGAPLTNYEYAVDAGANFVSRAPAGTSSPLVITGLSNGSNYVVRLRGVNAQGSGMSSAAVGGIPIITAPGAPTGVRGVPGDGKVLVSFTPPANSGGPAITGYTVSASPGIAAITGSASPLFVTGLTNGTPYTFTVTATNSVGTSAPSTPSAAVTPLPPTLAADRTAMNFAAVTTGTAFSSQTSGQVARLIQSGAGTVTWTASSNQPWLRVTPGSGTGSAALTVSTGFAPSLPTAGSAAGRISFTVSGASNTPPPIDVALTLTATPGVPFGTIDTPLDDSLGLSGSVAVTGWALDDIEVTELQLWRDPHPGDPFGAVFAGPAPQGGKVFVGYGSFVEGARPDVQTLNPAVPLNTRGGWGYLMLTRGLIWDGRGAFTLYAIAKDADGHVTQIGSRRIGVANASASAPFGSIDTPAQGATASGVYPNTGWVLTPTAGATIPAAGVQVTIDGVYLPGVPSTSDRADVTAGFPGFTTAGAGRGLFIDTTPYANGNHVIGWVVTDSTGKADGVGSRFFTVVNGGLRASGDGERLAAPDSATLSSLPAARTATGGRGYERDPRPTPLAPGDGRGLVQARELDLIRLALQGEGEYTGYLRVDGELLPLPAGSHLAGSRFSWLLGPAYVGTYDLVFVRWVDGVASDREEVRIVVSPQGS